MSPPNTAPIFAKDGAIGSALVTAANTDSEGSGTIGTDIFVAFTADATNGSYVERVRWIPTATTPTTTTPTVGRIFLSSRTSGPTTSANTFLFQEVALAALSADNSTTPNNFYDIVLGFALPPGWTILVTNHLAPAAGSAWRALTIAGDY